MSALLKTLIFGCEHSMVHDGIQTPGTSFRSIEGRNVIGSSGIYGQKNKCEKQSQGRRREVGKTYRHHAQIYTSDHASSFLATNHRVPSTIRSLKRAAPLTA